MMLPSDRGVYSYTLAPSSHHSYEVIDAYAQRAISQSRWCVIALQPGQLPGLGIILVTQDICVGIAIAQDRFYLLLRCDYYVEIFIALWLDRFLYIIVIYPHYLVIGVVIGNQDMWYGSFFRTGVVQPAGQVLLT